MEGYNAVEVHLKVLGVAGITVDMSRCRSSTKRGSSPSDPIETNALVGAVYASELRALSCPSKPLKRSSNDSVVINTPSATVSVEETPQAVQRHLAVWASSQDKQVGSTMSFELDVEDPSCRTMDLIVGLLDTVSPCEKRVARSIGVASVDLDSLPGYSEVLVMDLPLLTCAQAGQEPSVLPVRTPKTKKKKGLARLFSKKSIEEEKKEDLESIDDESFAEFDSVYTLDRTGDAVLRVEAEFRPLLKPRSTKKRAPALFNSGTQPSDEEKDSEQPDRQSKANIPPTPPRVKSSPQRPPLDQGIEDEVGYIKITGVIAQDDKTQSAPTVSTDSETIESVYEEPSSGLTTPPRQPKKTVPKVAERRLFTSSHARGVPRREARARLEKTREANRKALESQRPHVEKDLAVVAEAMAQVEAVVQPSTTAVVFERIGSAGTVASESVGTMSFTVEDGSNTILTSDKSDDQDEAPRGGIGWGIADKRNPFQCTGAFHEFTDFDDDPDDGDSWAGGNHGPILDDPDDDDEITPIPEEFMGMCGQGDMKCGPPKKDAHLRRKMRWKRKLHAVAAAAEDDDDTALQHSLADTLEESVDDEIVNKRHVAPAFAHVDSIEKISEALSKAEISLQRIRESSESRKKESSVEETPVKAVARKDEDASVEESPRDVAGFCHAGQPARVTIADAIYGVFQCTGRKGAVVDDREIQENMSIQVGDEDGSILTATTHEMRVDIERYKKKINGSKDRTQSLESKQEADYFEEYDDYSMLSRPSQGLDELTPIQGQVRKLV